MFIDLLVRSTSDRLTRSVESLTLPERGRLPSTMVNRTPKRISSRTDRPCAAARP